MFRRLLVAPLLAALILPISHAADAASRLRTIGCAKLGYTMLIPRDWTVSGACLAGVRALSDDKGILMVVKVTRKAVWNAPRARTAIAHDIAMDGTPIRFSSDVFQRTCVSARHRDRRDCWRNAYSTVRDRYLPIRVCLQLLRGDRVGGGSKRHSE